MCFTMTGMLLLVHACLPQSQGWCGTAYKPPQVAPEINIEHPSGRSFMLSDQRGVITLPYFGYTYYPDVCPATVAIMAQVFEQLEVSPDEMQFVMISIDPERETPEEVDAYMRRFNPDFMGLWINRDQLDPIQQAYRCRITLDTKLRDLKRVDHSFRFDLELYRLIHW
jgi:protein SCO1/2